MTKLAEIEALLFVSGEEGLSVRQIADLLAISTSAAQQSIEKLKEEYDQNKKTSLTIVETSNRYRLVTKPAYQDLLRRFSQTPINQSLSRAAMETLSIIAYKQPITRVEIDDIRGVNSSGAISTLQNFGLVKENGKKEVIGRPNLYITTDYFLDYIGINHLSDLPALQDELILEEQTLFDKEEIRDDL